MRNFQDYLVKKHTQFPQQFDQSGLSKQFVKYYENEQKVMVNTTGMILSGTIGITTGWKPCFLLMRTARSTGSTWTLSDKDEILAVKHGKEYISIK